MRVQPESAELALETSVLKREDHVVRWNQVALIGVGLLGGSVGLALKKGRRAGVVAGFVRRPASVRECKRAGAVDFATLDLIEAVADADLIILCTPIAQMVSLVKQLAPSLKRGVILTDVGSAKTGIVRELEGITHKAGGFFVGSHPMAGAEKAGVSAARADLFQGALCVVTPTPNTSRAALRKIESLWRSFGAQVLRMSPEKHDRLVSRSSHLPHVVAAVLAHSVLAPDEPKQQPRLCATGFRDTTRIASGSVEMWRDIALANRKNLDLALRAFQKQLQTFRRLLKRGDERAIAAFFEQAKRRRDQWAATGISSSLE